MKKRVLIGIFCAFICALFVAPAMADVVPDPKVVGNDVHYPIKFAKTIPEYNGTNVWCRMHDLSSPWVKATVDGDWIVVKGAADKRHHLYVGDPNDYKQKTNFCKAEQMGWIDPDKSFIHRNGNDINFWFVKK